MAIASKVFPRLTAGMLAGLTGSCQIEIHMRDACKRLFWGLRSLQIGIDCCSAVDTESYEKDD